MSVNIFAMTLKTYTFKHYAKLATTCFAVKNNKLANFSATYINNVSNAPADSCDNKNELSPVAKASSRT